MPRQQMKTPVKTVSREGSVDVAGPLEQGKTARFTTDEFDPNALVVKHDGGVSVSTSSSSGERRRSGR